MRIVSGKYKGKRLNPGKTFKARPTTDFAKENLFNVLGNYFEFAELEVLDLFSGTGSISYEFSSRGARHVDSVEVNHRYHLYIRDTARELGFDQLRAIRADAFRYLRNAAGNYDIIFADPPYELSNLDQLPEAVFNAGILKEGGWFILEHGKEHDFSDHPGFRELRKYGSVHFSIFIKR